MLGSAVAVSTAGGSLVPSLAGELSLAGEFSLAGERSLAGDSSLGGVVEADGTSGAASGHSWWGCSAPTQINSQDISREKSTHARLTAGSKL